MNKKKLNKKTFIQIGITTVLIIGIALLATTTYHKYTEYSIAKSNEIALEKAQKGLVDFTPTNNHNNKIKDNAYINAQFICQAPLETVENWELHEESCEEAALLQAYTYETKQNYTKEESNQIILKMLKWQEDNFGDHHDIYAEEFVDFASKFYKIDKSKFKLKHEATIKDIKRAITKGHPVIIGVDSTKLNNPYYAYEGYHMLLVKGYTKDKIITNDNGTRHGEDFSYTNESFQAAIDGSEKIAITLELN